MANYRTVLPGDIYIDGEKNYYRIDHLAKHAETSEEFIVYYRIDDRENILVNSHASFIEEIGVKNFVLISSGRKKSD